MSTVQTKDTTLLVEASQKELSPYSEWGALLAGCFVGFMWWVIHRKYFVSLYWFLVPRFRELGIASKSFDFVFAFINIETILMQGVSIGVAVGCLSRKRPYLSCVTALGLTFILKHFHDTFDIWNTARSAYATPWEAAFLAALYIGSTLFGTRAAQRLVHRLNRLASLPYFPNKK